LTLSGLHFDSDAAACVTGKRRETDIVVGICDIVQQLLGAKLTCVAAKQIVIPAKASSTPRPIGSVTNISGVYHRNLRT